MDQEIKRQIVENDRRFDMDKESSIRVALHTEVGFGPKGLKKAGEKLYTETLKFRENYQKKQADDGGLARQKLKANGCEIEQWFKDFENGGGGEDA